MAGLLVFSFDGRNPRETASLEKMYSGAKRTTIDSAASKQERRIIHRPGFGRFIRDPRRR